MRCKMHARALSLSRCYSSRNACLLITRRSDDDVGEEGEPIKRESNSSSSRSVEIWSCLILMYLFVDGSYRDSLQPERSELQTKTRNVLHYHRLPRKRLTTNSESVGQSLLQFLTRLLAGMRWDESGIYPQQKVCANHARGEYKTNCRTQRFFTCIGKPSYSVLVA